MKDNVKNFFNRSCVNLDSTYVCALACPKCQRQIYFRDKGKKVTGTHLSTGDFEKLVEYFGRIDFEGQYSDPVHHPKFIEFLKKCYEKSVEVEIHNASSTKSYKWYREAFQANPDAEWVFAIDGLPEESHKYRKNQDGEKLFNVMLDARNYLNYKPIWQYIVFNYNENHIDIAKEIAKENEIDFLVIYSRKWQGENDPLLPSKKFRV